MSKSSGKMQWSNPENDDRSWKLALAMYDLILKAGMGGLSMADAGSALTMLNGMFLASLGGDQHKREAVMRHLGQASVEHSKEAARIFRRVKINRAEGSA